MSFDKDTTKKSGTTSAGTFAVGLTGFPVDGDIVAGNMNEDTTLRTYIDTGAGDVNLVPGAITGIEEGDTIMFVKASADNNSITYTDPDGVTYDFVNRQSEFICLQYDGADYWVV